MAKTSRHHEPLLRTINELRLADLEMLSALCVEEGFTPRAIRAACGGFLEKGLIYRLWKHRDPKFRINRGSARQVFLISPKGAERLGLSPTEARTHETWYRLLANPRTEYRIDHELMISRVHTSLLVAQKHNPEALTLDVWEEGEGTQIMDGSRRHLTPDARFRLVSKLLGRAAWFFLEADTGNERLVSDDKTRRTIAGKLHRYGQADSKGIAVDHFKDMKGFSVLFVVPPRADAGQPSGRERGILDLIFEHGYLSEHAPRFYRVLSETDVRVALSAPTRYLVAPVVRYVTAAGEVKAEPLVPIPNLHADETAGYAAEAGR